MSVRRARVRYHGEMRSAIRGFGIGFLVFGLVMLGSARARAAEVLFVSDGFTDTNIADALRLDGHAVRVVINDHVEASGDNPTLRGDLSDYDVIYWSATGRDHRSPLVFLTLNAYVTDGGRVFVTGFDAIAAPEDTRMIAFLGGTASIDAGSALGPISMSPTSLSTGVVDIRGLTPAGHASDRDMLVGLGPDTIDIAPGSAPGLPDGSSWTLRRQGWGEIAFVSNGEAHMDHASWSDTRDDGFGAYNAAIRNFARVGDILETEPGAPEIALDGPHITLEGAPIELVARVSDPGGGSVSVAWDLDADGLFEERIGELSAGVPGDYTDGPSTLEIRCRAQGGGGVSLLTRVVRVLNGDPEIRSSPPRLFHAEEPARYALEAWDPAGWRDELGFEVVSGPRGVSVDAAGVLTWTPSATQVTRGGDVVWLHLRVLDDDGASAEQRWSAEVSANRPPPAPAILHPARGTRLRQTPRLVIENVEDPNHDTVSYWFELDSAPTFDSSELQLSGSVAPGVGYTTWMPEGLRPGPGYHWRAWAFDGEFASPIVAGSFWIGAAPSSAPDSAPPTQPEGGPDVERPAAAATGCDCGIGAGQSPIGAAGLTLLALWSSRRRRR